MSLARAEREPAWEAVIGLEVHVQLLTEAKLFSTERTTFGAEPNSHVSEICAGMPGALPLLNRRAVELCLLAGAALGCELQPHSRFARKHYFYPDLPKGYQISQYELPIFLGGAIEFPTGGGWGRCRLKRIHMEEDAGKLLHRGEHSLVDLNRAGTPLIEIVTEPDLRSAEEAGDLLRQLRVLFRYLAVSDCNMQEGSLRCDANVSIRRRGDDQLGIRSEIKNLNSFRFVERALRHEIERQVAIREEGGEVVQETRLYDEATGATRPMRGKEEAEDYRYFPDPDLPPLIVDEAWAERVRFELPELPHRRRRRYEDALGVPAEAAALLTRNRETGDYFDAVVVAGAEPALAAGQIVRYLLPAAEAAGAADPAAAGVPAADLAALLAAVAAGRATKTMARAALEEAIGAGRPVSEVLAELAARRDEDEERIRRAVAEALSEHAEVAAEYRAGTRKVIGFLIGRVLERLEGRGDPAAVRAALERALEE